MKNNTFKARKSRAKRNCGHEKASSSSSSSLAQAPRPPVFPVPICSDAIADFKRVFLLSYYPHDPTFLDELAKLQAKWPLQAPYFSLCHFIPELRALSEELWTRPPPLKPGSFTITLLNDDSARYTLSIIPGGRGTGPVANPTGVTEFAFIYTLYILKGTVADDGKVENETIMHLDEQNHRFLVESFYSDRQTWEPAVPNDETLASIGIRTSGNYRITDTKTDKVLFTLNTLRTIGDAVREEVRERQLSCVVES